MIDLSQAYSELWTKYRKRLKMVLIEYMLNEAVDTYDLLLQ